MGGRRALLEVLEFVVGFRLLVGVTESRRGFGDELVPCAEDRGGSDLAGAWIVKRLLANIVGERLGGSFGHQRQCEDDLAFVRLEVLLLCIDVQQQLDQETFPARSFELFRALDMRLRPLLIVIVGHVVRRWA